MAIWRSELAVHGEAFAANTAAMQAQVDDLQRVLQRGSSLPRAT